MATSVSSTAPVNFPLALPNRPIVSPSDAHPEVYAEIDRIYKAIWQVAVKASGASAGITQLTGDVTAGPGSGSQVTVLDPSFYAAEWHSLYGGI